MYRMLIVDDEAIIADGLHEVFATLQEPVLDVYKAYSGEEALEWLKKTRIDIVLTDISMPGMDGLELLREIHRHWPQCRVIFLTGYNEFDYVYTAIQYEGVGYILKTEGYDKVIATVRETVGEIDQRLRRDALERQTAAQLDAMGYLLQGKFLNSVLRGEIGPGEIEQKHLDEMNIALRCDRPVAVLLGHIDEQPSGLTYFEKSRRIYSIRLIVEQYFPRQVRSAYFESGGTDLIWLLQADEDAHSEEIPDWMAYIRESLDLIQESCLESLGFLLSFALEDGLVEWGKLQGRYVTLRMLLSHHITPGAGILLTNSTREETPQEPAQSREMPARYLYEQLAEALEYGRRDEYFAMFEKLVPSLSVGDAQHDLAVWEAYYSISLVLMSYINKYSLLEAVAAKISLRGLIKPYEGEMWEAAQYLRELSGVLFAIQSSEKEKRALDAMGMVQQHIEENIHNQDEISLIRLADLLHFNPSYLSRLFKQTTGSNLSDYIGEVRIRHARQLLDSTNMRVQEIAEAVGYGSATNFTRFFKKTIGVTPQEYRDRLRMK